MQVVFIFIEKNICLLSMIGLRLYAGSFYFHREEHIMHAHDQLIHLLKILKVCLWMVTFVVGCSINLKNCEKKR